MEFVYASYDVVKDVASATLMGESKTWQPIMVLASFELSHFSRFLTSVTLVNLLSASFPGPGDKAFLLIMMVLLMVAQDCDSLRAAVPCTRKSMSTVGHVDAGRVSLTRHSYPRYAVLEFLMPTWP